MPEPATLHLLEDHTNQNFGCTGGYMLLNRRFFLKSGLALASLGSLASRPGSAAARPLATRHVPSIGEELPLVGLGSWITFNVGNDAKLLKESTEVIAAFLMGGGRMIDSSPMYGSSQATIGYALRKLGHPDSLFSADKVWTSSQSNGPTQMERSRQHWGVAKFDLMQVHNLLNWEGHLETLSALKADGRLAAIGITTSHGARHPQLEKIMLRENIDFVQLTYNALDRAAEQRLLPLAQEKGIGIIANRPYRRGGLIRRVAGQPLPRWAADFEAASWAQFLLKFVISHPAVTCAIPATTRVDHVLENLATAKSTLPDQRQRERMAKYISSL